MLHNFVSVYVPSTQNVGQPLPDDKRAALLARTCGRLAREFGGCTAVDGTGYWIDTTGNLIPERVTIVTSYHDGSNPERTLEWITNIAREIAREYGQEAVTIQTNDGIEFITAETVPA